MRSQHVMVDGFRSYLVNVVSGLPKDIFSLVIVPTVDLGAFSIFENKLIVNADDYILIAVVRSLGV